jgi:hypothetical protein
MLVYKVVETSTELERIINEWVPRGWAFDGVRFVQREASRRPAMAFVTFTRDVSDEDAAVAAPGAAKRRKTP